MRIKLFHKKMNPRDEKKIAKQVKASLATGEKAKRRSAQQELTDAKNALVLASAQRLFSENAHLGNFEGIGQLSTLQCFGKINDTAGNTRVFSPDYDATHISFFFRELNFFGIVRELGELLKTLVFAFELGLLFRCSCFLQYYGPPLTSLQKEEVNLDDISLKEALEKTVNARQFFQIFDRCTRTDFNGNWDKSMKDPRRERFQLEQWDIGFSPVSNLSAETPNIENIKSLTHKEFTSLSLAKALKLILIGELSFCANISKDLKTDYDNLFNLMKFLSVLATIKCDENGEISSFDKALLFKVIGEINRSLVIAILSIDFPQKPFDNYCFIFDNMFLSSLIQDIIQNLLSNCLNLLLIDEQDNITLDEFGDIGFTYPFEYPKSFSKEIGAMIHEEYMGISGKYKVSLWMIRQLLPRELWGKMMGKVIPFIAEQIKRNRVAQAKAAPKRIEKAQLFEKRVEEIKKEKASCSVGGGGSIDAPSKAILRRSKSVASAPVEELVPPAPVEEPSPAPVEEPSPAPVEEPLQQKRGLTALKEKLQRLTINDPSSEGGV